MDYDEEYDVDDRNIQDERLLSQGSYGTLNVPKTCVFVVGIMAGSGFLALPKSVDNTGWVGIILLALFCLLSFYTSTFLSRCWQMMLERGLLPPNGHIRYPYPAIGEAAFGKYGKYAVSVAINFTNFGTVVVYILVAAENRHTLLTDYTSMSTCILAVIVTGSVVPVTWFGTPKDFWGTALAATIATLTASLLVFSNILKDRQDFTDVVHTNVDVVSFFTAFGTMAFSYGGHCVFPTVMADMKRPKHFWKASLIGYIVLLVIYMPSSIASYITYGQMISPNVLDTVSRGPMRTIAAILMTLHLYFGIIIIANPVCQEVENIIGIENKFFTIKRAVCRTFVMGSALFVAESVPHFSSILALVGGSTITLLAYICPTIFFLKLASAKPSNSDRWDKINVPLHVRVLCIEIVALGLIAGVAATYSAISDLAASRFSTPCYINSRAES